MTIRASIRSGVAVALLAAGCVATSPRPVTPAAPGATPGNLVPSTGARPGVLTSPSPEQPSPELTEPPVQQPPSATYVAMAFFDESHGLVGGSLPNGTDSGANPARGALATSSDGGRIWKGVPFDGEPLLALDAAGPRSVWAATGCLDRTCRASVLRSDDRGRSWTSVSKRLVDSLSAVDAEHAWAVTSTGLAGGGRAIRTSDGGRTWQNLEVPCPWGGVDAVSFVTARHGWAACGEVLGAGTEFKSVLETRDAGTSWRVRSEADPDRTIGRIFSSDYVGGFAMRETGVGMMWMDRGTTTRTRDGGVTWDPIPPGEFDVTLPGPAALIDDETWILFDGSGNGGGPLVEKTTNAGDSWEVIAALGG